MVRERIAPAGTSTELVVQAEVAEERVVLQEMVEVVMQVHTLQ